MHTIQFQSWTIDSVATVLGLISRKSGSLTRIRDYRDELTVPCAPAGARSMSVGDPASPTSDGIGIFIVCPFGHSSDAKML